MSNRILVAGIGNIFLGDDGFGVEVANRLLAGPVPDGATVEDFGIRGVHLAYELLNGYDALILVDAAPMGEPPGTVAVIDAGTDTAPSDDGMGGFVDAHTMSPAVVLGILASLGGSVEQVLVVGCEPANLDEGIGLSPVVAEAVMPAVELCGQLMSEMLQLTGRGSRR